MNSYPNTKPATVINNNDEDDYDNAQLKRHSFAIKLKAIDVQKRAWIMKLHVLGTHTHISRE